jgi:integrase/recombinase XerD
LRSKTKQNELFRTTSNYPTFLLDNKALCHIIGNPMQKDALLQKAEQELKVRNLSPKTRKSYLGALRKYFDYKQSHLDRVDVENIKKYICTKLDAGAASQTVNVHLNAIKFFYREVLQIRTPISVHYAKKPSKIPVVLSRREIESILEHAVNRKHKLLLSLAYGAGLRVSEVVNLRVLDIDPQERTVCIREGKGRKDRLTVLPEKLVGDLQRMMDGKNSLEYLFESQRGGRLSTETVQKVFAATCAKAALQKNATFHFPIPCVQAWTRPSA